MQQCKIPRDCATTTLKRGYGRQRWARRHRALTAALFLTFRPDAIHTSIRSTFLTPIEMMIITCRPLVFCLLLSAE